MSDTLFDLPCLERGRRVETVQWATRCVSTIPGVVRAGQINPAPSREYAEGRATEMWGGRVFEVVSRTVVTYTADWQPIGGDV